MYPDTLFVEAAKLTRRGEDLFTLAVAATLGEDEHLLRAFLHILFGASLRDRVPAGAPLAVRTHVTHRRARDNSRHVPDMVVDVGGQPLIVLEHKLRAPEGASQVENYLSLPRKAAPHVAFIAGYYASTVSGADHPRYLRHPSGRLHFVWGDFYDLFVGTGAHADVSPSGLRRATAALFDAHLFQPAHWAVAGLRDPERTKAADTAVAELLEPTRAALAHHSRGYEIAPSWRTASEFYAMHGHSERVPEVRVAPGVVPGALKVVLKATTKEHALEAKDRVMGGLPAATRRSSIAEYRHMGYSGRGNPHAVEVFTPWSVLLGRFTSERERPQMAAALKRHIIGMVTLAS